MLHQTLTPVPRIENKREKEKIKIKIKEKLKETWIQTL